MRGVKLDDLPEPVRRGVFNHRAVDRFTDQFPAVVALKPLFDDRYRRFAGIIIDVSFDYFLTKHWASYHDQSVRTFLDSSYLGLLAAREYMPTYMKQAVERMTQQDWLGGYSELRQVGFALDRVAERMRFRNNFTGAGQEVEHHYLAIEQAFLALYPALQDHVAALGLEDVQLG